jgi:hypothetical protein
MKFEIPEIWLCVLGMALGALAHGLQLDHMLDKSIREEEIETVVTLFLDAMLPLQKLR